MRNNVKCLLFLSLAFSTMSLDSCASYQSDSAHKVYICTGPGAYAYHEDSNCALMMNRCTGTIKEISITKARKMKRKPCGKCAD